MENSNHQIAGFWKRSLAFIFDLLVINIIIFWPFQKLFSKYFTGISKENLMMSESLIPGKIYFAIMIIFILIWLYFTFFDYYLGQTIGQMMLNIKVISLTDNMLFWKALIRNAFVLPILPVFYIPILWIVETLYMIFYKERFLEKITATRTIILQKKSYLKEYNLKKVQ